LLRAGLGQRGVKKAGKKRLLRGGGDEKLNPKKKFDSGFEIGGKWGQVKRMGSALVLQGGNGGKRGGEGIITLNKKQNEKYTG